MSRTVIKTEAIGKKYNLTHQRKKSYYLLRDAMTDTVERWGHTLLHALTSRCEPQPRREEFWALKDISFEIKAGERVGIIGRNGAGKSTLLKILSRITEPSAGRFAMRGRVASLLEVGTGFHPELTGRENVFLNGAILGMKKAEVRKKFDEIVSFAEVERFLDTPVKRYSSGMYVRLAFAVAAHLEPEILIVDEVLAVGDAHFQKKCLGKMETSGKDGRTVLFVSHNMNTIQLLCNRSLLIAGGQISKDGASADVIKSYLSSIKDHSNALISLYDVVRSSGLGEQIRFTKCTLINETGKITTQLLYGEHITLNLEAISVTQLEQLSIVVGVDSFYGNRIVTVASEEKNIFFSVTGSDPLKIKVKLEDVILTPGSYWLHLGIRSGCQGLDEIKNTIAFDILETPREGMRAHPGTWGHVYAHADWSAVK